jgi:hypothetical protein
MNCLTTIPRISMMFAAAALLAACTPPAADDEGETGESGETGDTGSTDDCVDPGTELLPDIVKPAILPMPQTATMYMCTSGWGTDTSRLASDWTVQVGDPVSDFNYLPPVLVAHPDGGVVIATLGEVAHYGSDGEPLWSNPGVVNGQMYLAVEEAGTILLGAYDWGNEDTFLNRYAADGTLMGEIAIAWNSQYANIWGVTTFGTDIVLGANDEDEQGFYESTLLRLDVDGNVLLRKSTNLANGNALAATSGGVALFGTFPGFLVDLDSGAVLGMLTPTSGNIGAVIGAGDEFIVASNVNNATNDLGIGRYSSIGGEQWLQSYDRATLSDFGRGVAADGNGNFVVVGNTQMLDFSDQYWFNTQPVVFGVDADGNPLWTDRISAHADTTAVAVDLDGHVYVAGMGDAGIGFDENSGEQPPVVAWLRRYTP